MRFSILLACAFTWFAAASGWGEVAIVEDGKAGAVVVTAEKPLPVAQYAAEELVYHVEKATGVKLQIVTENAMPPGPAGRIYIGDCQAARTAGIEAGKLPPEAVVLRTTGPELFIVGEDGDGDPLSTETHAGTLWGVYELLERVLKVRWLWPGELGVHVPKADVVKVADLDETIKPWLFQRNVRPGLNLRYGDPQLAFSKEAREKYAHEQQVFLRRHRMGRSLRLRYGHAFEGWWKKYGTEHPDWFQLLEDGRRGPAHPNSRYSMCVSNPGFHQKIVELWKEQKEKNPDEFLNINCCENDIRGMCTCERCLAWDGPQPENIPTRFGPRVVSDRYARFYGSVQQLAAREDPSATAVGYAYVNYYPAPRTEIRLNQQVVVGLVPDLFFPRSPEDQEWVKQQWAGWEKTGARLFLRPNYLLQGYCMPHIFAHQFADEFQFAARHGMAATDFDSLTGQWSTQGPNLYLLMRLHLRPERSADELLSEYYEAFGPAAQQVKSYFDYWENYITENRERFAQVAEERHAGWSSYAKMADALFPPPCFEPAEKMLNEAVDAAAGSAECLARVSFLQDGLRHAMLCARLCALLSGEDKDAAPVAWGRAREELLSFRRSVEMEGIANFHYCANIEGRSWKLPVLYNGEAFQPLVETPVPLEGSPILPTRGTHTFVAALKEEEHFRARLACKRIGQYTDAAEWRLFGPNDAWITKGSVPPGEEAMIESPLGPPGIYVLLVQSGRNSAQVTLLNDHAALGGREIHLVGEASPMFFFIPEGTSQFTLTLESPGPGETARARLFDPEGKEVAVATTGQTRSCAMKAKAAPAQDGRAWSVRIERADTGVLEDYTLTLGPDLPAYWSQAADRLVVPAKP